ncbi:MAG TPA: hypothetical protein VK633_08770, partial [Verrucomicrobiae bacterium]|nr:hypothetical protein [Verrucomicrobiae bacterium]
RAASYPVFLWASLSLINVGEILPDLLLIVWVLLAAGYALELPQKSYRSPLLLGVVLGLGYLTKPILFPLGLLFLACSLLAEGDWRWKARRTLVAALCFLAISGLYIVPLSLKKQRPTFSDSGALAYGWEVNRISPYFHWQGRPPGTGSPRHPTRQILEFPPAYEFDTDQPGTYPLWFDASYWNEGLRPRFNLSDQMRRLRTSLRFYGKLLLNEPVPVVLLFSFLLSGVTAGWRPLFREARVSWFLILFSLGALGLYSLVFVISRYLASFAVLLVISALGAHWAAIGGLTGPVRRWTLAFSIFTTVSVAASGAASAAYGLFGGKPTTYKVHALVAHELRKMGIKHGDKLAVVGRGCDPYYARLSGTKIIAEAPVFEGHPEWPHTAENLEKIAAAFREQTRAAAIVSDVQPVDESFPNLWHRVKETPYWLRKIKRD